MRDCGRTRWMQFVGGSARVERTVSRLPASGCGMVVLVVVVVVAADKQRTTLNEARLCHKRHSTCSITSKEEIDTNDDVKERETTKYKAPPSL
jgi:hypothetical protein